MDDVFLLRFYVTSFFIFFIGTFKKQGRAAIFVAVRVLFYRRNDYLCRNQIQMLMDTMFYRKTDRLFLITLIERDDGTKKKQVLAETTNEACLQAENDFVGSVWSSRAEWGRHMERECPLVWIGEDSLVPGVQDYRYSVQLLDVSRKQLQPIGLQKGHQAHLERKFWVKKNPTDFGGDSSHSTSSIALVRTILGSVEFSRFLYSLHFPHGLASLRFCQIVSKSSVNTLP